MYALSDRVIVRLWYSALRGQDGFGHVSIQTRNYYMSLWPQGKPGGKIKQYFETRGPHFVSELEIDERYEGYREEAGKICPRKADCIVCLYDLNIGMMEAKFLNLKETIKGWTIIGENRLINNSDVESCSSMAFKILRAGGMDSDSYCFSSSITPDELGETIVAYKKKELKKLPETKNFKYEFETELDLQKDKAQKPSCRIL